MECLRAHREDLSAACRAEELHLNIVQARDVRLRPKLRRICAHEVTTHCKDVKPGLRPPGPPARCSEPPCCFPGWMPVLPGLICLASLISRGLGAEGILKLAVSLRQYSINRMHD